MLCGSNYYEQKYFFNEEIFGKLPQQVKEELKIMCVLFTEDVGGALFLVFDPEEGLMMRTECDENDLLYDEIGSVLSEGIAGGKEGAFGILGIILQACYSW